MVEELVNDLILEVGQIGLWLRTVGVIFVIWIIFDVYNFIANRRRIRILKRIEEKVDKLLRKNEG
jgi:hypothetical protein